MKEEWRSVPGFESELVVSNLGRVARICGFDYAGYRAVSVTKQAGHHTVLTGRRTWRPDPRASAALSIHRIVALAFLGEPSQPDMDVNHKDGNKSNNTVDNLEWATRRENLAHALRMGLRTQHRVYSIKQADKARLLYAHGHTMAIILRETGLSRPAAIYAIYDSRYPRRGRRLSHGA